MTVHYAPSILNVNGIRAAIRKGRRYFSSIDADIWMLQEVRALPEQLPNWSWPEGYDVRLHTAEKKVIQELQRCLVQQWK